MRISSQNAELLEQTGGEETLVAKSSANAVDRTREEPIAIRFVCFRAAFFKKGELVGGRVGGKRRQPDTEQTRRNAA
jgi:hypothetical protein